MVEKIQDLLHPKGFFAALWPYRFTAIAFGHCNTKSKKLRASYTLIMVSASFLYSYFVGYNIYGSKLHNQSSDVQTVIAYFAFSFDMIVTPMHILTWFFIGHSCFWKFVASLTVVDREMEKICSKSINFKITVIKQLVCISLPVLLTLIRIAGLIYYGSNAMSWWFIFEISTSHYSWTASIVLMSFFGNLARFIGDRYALINCTLEGIGCTSMQMKSSGNRSRVISDRVTLTRQLRVVHGKLFFVSQMLIKAFGIQAFTFVLSSICFTIYDLFMQYRIVASPSGKFSGDRILLSFIEVLYDFCVFTYVAYCCHRTVSEANETTKILNGLITADSEDLRLEASSFSHQLMHYNLHFSPLGFFPFDLGLVQSVFGSIATYLVILIQIGSVPSDSMDSTAAEQIE